MREREWPLIAGLAAFGLAVAALALLTILGIWVPAYSVAGALAVLATGQIYITLTLWSRGSALEERLARQTRLARSLADAGEAQAKRIEGLEERLKSEADTRVDSVVTEMRSLRDSFHDMKERMERDRRQAGESPPQASGDQLELLLEPVIELASETTAHYRAQLRLVNGTLGEVGYSELMTKAELGGLRPPLDLHMLKQCLPALRRLRAKHPARRIFVPLGASTLVAKNELDRIVSAIEGDADVADGLVLEFAHAQLASLTPEGIEGLARLGRRKLTMALANVTIAGLDLASLRQLGVRYLEVESGAMDVGFGVAPSWLEFAQFAKAMQFQLIAGGVVSAKHAAAAVKVARFARGPYFAPPRRLRSNSGNEAVYGQSQAA
jgi:EAL domain-containing protein (putative c-di-GMP-specific phosphodiesterase class I)